MKYFKMSADLGESRGMLNYGIALAKGFNGTINLPEAMKFMFVCDDLFFNNITCCLNRELL
jgi:hypothetical protein